MRTAPSTQSGNMGRDTRKQDLTHPLLPLLLTLCTQGNTCHYSQMFAKQEAEGKKLFKNRPFKSASL